MIIIFSITTFCNSIILMKIINHHKRKNPLQAGFLYFRYWRRPVQYLVTLSTQAQRLLRITMLGDKLSGDFPPSGLSVNN